MAFCKSEEFTIAKVGNSFCNFVLFHYATNKNGKVKKGLSKFTIGKLHSFLNRAYEDAIKNRIVKYNPCQGVKKPKKNKHTPTICSETSSRTISVPEFVTTTIAAYLTSLKVVPELIFSEFQPDSYSKHFSQLLTTYSLPPMRFHDLRHFNAVIMMKYGVPDKVASQRLGHSQVQITREIYQHVLPDMDRQATSVIEGVFAKRTEDTIKTEQG